MSVSKQTLTINGRQKIGKGLAPYIIAELGTNHNRDIETAKRMLQQLQYSGADCAKFQIYEPGEIVSRNIRAADYKLDHIYGDISAYDMFDNHLKTPKAWFPELKNLCVELGLDFAVTLHGSKGIDWANRIGVDFVKVASMDHTNLPFLSNLVNAMDVPIIASLGMARLEDIDNLVEALSQHRCGFALMHCAAIYPPTQNELRMSNIAYLTQRYQAPIGFSDHTLGTQDACDGLDMGAVFFEKHFSLDKLHPGPDHPFAMEPEELKTYVATLKNHRVQNKLDRAVFVEPFGRELDNRGKYLKSIFVNKALEEGTVLTENDLYCARPATGLPPKELSRLIGKKLNRALSEDSMLSETDFA